jgi:hypothetical protein
MFRKITAVALTAAATLAVAAGPADAARSMQYVDTGTTFEMTTPIANEKNPVPQKYISGTDGDYCEGQAKAANSWIDAAVAAWHQDDAAGQAAAQRNADAIAGEANAQGCIIFD